METLNTNKIVTCINSVVINSKDKSLDNAMIYVESDLSQISTFFNISKKCSFIFSHFLYVNIQQNGCFRQIIAKYNVLRGATILNFTEDIIELCLRGIIYIKFPLPDESSMDIEINESIFDIRFETSPLVISNIMAQRKSDYPVSLFNIINTVGKLSPSFYAMFDDDIIKSNITLPIIGDIKQLSVHNRWLIFYLIHQYLNNNPNYIIQIHVRTLD